MVPESSRSIGRQLLLPEDEFAPMPMIVSASRRTELVALRPNWLVQALQRFPGRYKRDIHSVVLWTKDPTNIYEHKALREELSKYNLMVHFTMTGLGGSRIEPTVPEPEVLLQRMPELVEFLGDPKRLRWRFDPIITLEREDGSHWSSAVYFEALAKEIAKLGIDNCYFSFMQVYPRKFQKRRLNEAGIFMITPPIEKQIAIVEQMQQSASTSGITLYSCAQPFLENVPGITPAKCIDAQILVELHQQHTHTQEERDETQAKYRPSCYCTESRDIGSYFPCGHGCVYCYAEAAVPPPEKLVLKEMPQ